MPRDDELLAFDRSRLADADRLNEQALLKQHGDLYRSHLAIALWVSGWQQRLNERRTTAEDQFDGKDYALGEIAAHLRQGDFLPGGPLLLDLDA